jgi:cellulose synthase/poly-beta-1,6-N-acetylglucosamine synthase-like glycosyltransferase
MGRFVGMSFRPPSNGNDLRAGTALSGDNELKSTSLSHESSRNHSGYDDLSRRNGGFTGGKVPLSLTVCIPAYNESANIGGLLEFLLREVGDSFRLCQVIVETSGSVDGTAQAVEEVTKRDSRVSVLDSGVRLGLIGAINRLFAAAMSDVILRMDADIVPPTGFIEQLVRRLRSPGAGIVGPQIVPESIGNRAVDSIATALYTIQHLACIGEPRTTNVQLLWNLGLQLEPDTESEDNAIQELVVNSGYASVYASDVVVSILPPATVADMLRHRIRCVSTLRTYHRKTGQRPPTQKFKSVLRAMFEAAKSGTVSPFGLAGLVVIEVGAHTIVSVRAALVGPSTTRVWTPLSSTKLPRWNGEGKI